jgi:DivIVA domain-containing protein
LPIVELDRQSIERRDFPTARRGYDPVAVDAHLRAVAVAVAELAQRLASEPSLGSAAATQVQGILEAAQTTAAEIAREARRDAQRTREDAARELEQARAHVETLARAATALLAQVESLDGEVGALAQSLRAAGGESPSGEERRDGSGASAGAAAAVGREALGGEGEGGSVQPAIGAAKEAAERSAVQPAPAPTPPTPAPALAPASRADASRQEGGEDLDGARLVALNMALGGESREQTDRYLADSFQLLDRAKLLDEVYAAIEG